MSPGDLDGPVILTLPSPMFLEQPTMQLRWYGGVLEQAFTRTSQDGRAVEVIWRPVPSIG